MKDVDDVPTKHILPGKLTTAGKRQYFNDVIGDFVKSYVLQRGQAADVEDKIKNYGLTFIYMTVMLFQLEDTAWEGDGEKHLINQKLLIPLFKSLGSFSKYTVEMFVAVSQVEVTATPRMAQELKWGYFTNWRGGAGRNIEENMTQEIFNRLSKEIVKRMGANKKIASIQKVSKAVGGIKIIKDNFDETIDLHPDSERHNTIDSMSDKLEMITELVTLNQFQHQNGRCLRSFKNIKRNHLLGLNVNAYGKWLEEQMEKLKSD